MHTFSRSLPRRAGSLAAVLAAALGTAHGAEPVRASPALLALPLHGVGKARPRAVAAPGVVPRLTAGATLTVTSCDDDDGFDTLRHAVLVANSGDTIDLSTLSCSTITLEKGEIGTGLADLTIVGPGRDRLAIDGAANGRVFNHTGTGQLTLSGVTVKNGVLAADMAYGGCILSQGDVGLYQAAVTGCTALGQTKGAGGGIVAYGGVRGRNSVISGNTASASVGKADDLSAAGGGLFGVEGTALYSCVVTGNSAHAPTGSVYGGGVASGTGFVMKYSTVSANDASSAGNNLQYAYGGGLLLFGTANIVASTIEGNSADAAGGMGLSASDYNVSVVSSTLSGNEGRLGIGALQSMATLSLNHVTIAFNDSGALAKLAVSLNGTTTMNGTIIADNPGADVLSQTPITGAKNLIKVASGSTVVPADTIIVDPKLGELSFNGGPTRTHALGEGSPAINAGPLTSSFYEYDQRGPTYLRVVGPASDIGAFEVDTDHIFGTAFDHPLSP
jgi:hypothetical protein